MKYYVFTYYRDSYGAPQAPIVDAYPAQQAPVSYDIPYQLPSSGKNGLFVW